MPPMTARLTLALLLLATPAFAQWGPGDRPRGPALAEGVEDPGTLLRMAEAALANRRLYEAADLLERAESRLLTRSELASEADRPAVGGAIGELAAARDALARRDSAGARALVASAAQRLERGEAPLVPAFPEATGPGVGPAPASGGGSPRAKTQPLPPGGLPVTKPIAR
jgi:hypothetical protein